MMNWKLHVTTSTDYLIRIYQYDRIYTLREFNSLGPNIQMIEVEPLCRAARLADLALSNEAFICYDNKIIAAACYARISITEYTPESKESV